jgi:hypothetical protein
MPVKSYQLTAMPQLQDKAQARLQQTQGRLTHVVDELLLSAGDDIRAPQQQPGVDQRQGQQQAVEALGLAHPGEFQAKPAAIVFEIFEHFLNAESRSVTLAGEFTGRFGGNEVPRLDRSRCPIHGQVEARDRMFL